MTCPVVRSSGLCLPGRLAKNPAMLFADEPTGTLDPETARLVHEMLIEAARKNSMGMVVTSHFSHVIEDMASRAILLADGSIAAIGSPKSVIKHVCQRLPRNR